MWAADQEEGRRVTVPVSSRWLTVADAARYLGVSVATVRRWTNTGALKCFTTPGGQRRFDERELEAWLRERSR